MSATARPLDRPPVEIRPARDGDVERTYAVFVEAADDLSRQLGRPAHAGVGAPPVRALALRRSLLRHDGDRYWVAEAEGLVVGFAMGVLRDDVWHLAALHVVPRFQGGGIGTELTRRAMTGVRPTTALTVITDASNPISNAIYMRAGMVHQDATLTFDAAVDALADDEQPDLEHRPIDLVRDDAVLGSLDQASIGFARPVDHAFWGSVPGLAGHLLIRDGSVRGSLHVADTGAIGPVAVHDPDDLVPALRLGARLARTAGADAVHLRLCGAARPAAAWLAAHGARLSGIGLFLSSRPVGHLDRYVTSGGDALY